MINGAIFSLFSIKDSYVLRLTDVLIHLVDERHSASSYRQAPLNSFGRLIVRRQPSGARVTQRKPLCLRVSNPWEGIHAAAWRRDHAPNNDFGQCRPRNVCRSMRDDRRCLEFDQRSNFSCESCHMSTRQAPPGSREDAMNAVSGCEWLC
mgnify:CR=1 FL=1